MNWVIVVVFIVFFMMGIAWMAEGRKAFIGVGSFQFHFRIKRRENSHPPHSSHEISRLFCSKRVSQRIIETASVELAKYVIGGRIGQRTFLLM